MAKVTCDHDSNSDDEVMALCLPNPPSKRRRILHPSSITAVPIYSNKITRRRKLKPAVFKQIDCTEVNEDVIQLRNPSVLKSKNKLSDPEKKLQLQHEEILEVNDVPFQINDSYNDDDDIIISSEMKQKRFSAKSKLRKRAHKIALKFHCRLDVHKIPVCSTDPLSKAITQLSVKLKVPPSKILLMRNGDELSVHSTITQLDLGSADIIDCVLFTDDNEDESSCDVITVRLQGKEKGSVQEYSLRKNSPLESVLSQYTSGLSAADRHKVKFLFDGIKLTLNQTPSQLEMEDGDVIDVWT